MQNKNKLKDFFVRENIIEKLKQINKINKYQVTLSSQSKNQAKILQKQELERPRNFPDDPVLIYHDQDYNTIQNDENTYINHDPPENNKNEKDYFNHIDSKINKTSVEYNQDIVSRNDTHIDIPSNDEPNPTKIQNTNISDNVNEGGQKEQKRRKRDVYSEVISLTDFK